jgi:Uma2 family endonuclease
MNIRIDKDIIRPEDLDLIVDGDLYEFVHGMPVEKRMGAKSDEIAGLLLTMLNNFARPRGLGRVYGAQTGYRCFPHDEKLVRKPDTSFVARGRLPGDQSPDGNIEIAPDLAVEVVSPNDLYEEVEAKVRDYRSAGVKHIWIVSPESKTVLVRRLDGTCTEVGEAGELSGEGVVPGFTCKVAELFV